MQTNEKETKLYNILFKTPNNNNLIYTMYHTYIIILYEINIIIFYSRSLHFEDQPKNIVFDERLLLPDSVNNHF